jgi:hypothetical protein
MNLLSKLSDNELINLFNAGNVSAFEVLVYVTKTSFTPLSFF